jgi:hypothetical protein
MVLAGSVAVHGAPNAFSTGDNTAQGKGGDAHE